MPGKILSLFILSLVFITKGFPQSGRITELRAIIKNYPIGADTALVNVLNTISSEYVFSKPDSTIYFAKKSEELARKLNYTLGEVRSVGNLAKAFYVKGSYDLSLNYTLQAKDVSEKIKDTYGLAFAHNNIGLIHLTQNKIQDAINDFLVALNLAKASGNINTEASAYINLGIAYSNLAKHDTALNYLNTGLDHSKKHKLNRYAVMILNHMAENYYQTGQFEKAINHYQSVIDYEGYRSDWESSFAHSGIGRIELERGNERSAIENAQKALKYARLVNAKFDISRSLQILYAAYAKSGDYKNALKYLELEKIYSDSLFNEAKEKEINRLNLERKNAENAKLQKLIEENKEQIRINELIIKVIAGLALFLLILTVLVVKYNRQKSKLNDALSENSKEMELQNDLIRSQNVQLENLNRTKDRLFSIIGHDLRGPFGNMLQLMEMMREGSISDEELKGFMNDFYEKVHDMSYMLDNLIAWAGSQQQGLKSAPENISLNDQVESLLRLFKSQIQEKSINMIHNQEIDTTVFADPDHVLIILRNLIANAIKFTPSGGMITVSYETVKDELVMLIKDSGIGISPEKLRRLFRETGKNITSYGTNDEKGIGIGLMLVKQFADENNIEIEVNSVEGKGTEFVLRFKRNF